MKRLDGKVIMVTGAARGQGLLEAEAIVAEGGTAVMCDVLAEEGSAAAQRLSEDFGPARFYDLDVTSSNDWAHVCDEVLAEFGRIDGLVNNAGVSHRVSLMDTTHDAWSTIMDVNLTGPALGIQAVAPAMMAARSGSIVNISSIAGLCAWPAVAYSVSKWGLRGLTKSAALEFGMHDIRVNSIHPGVVATELMEDAPEQFRNAYAGVVPLRREAQPAEIAPLVVYLCSEESTYVTGAEISVDGGFSAAGAAQGMMSLMNHSGAGSQMLAGTRSGLDGLADAVSTRREV